MKKYLTGAALLALGASQAFAAGLDRSGQSVMAVFDESGTAKVSFGVVLPSVTGKDITGGGTYDAALSYNQMSLSYTRALGQNLSLALIADQPYGADISYDQSPLTSNLGGTGADLNSSALNFILKYQVGTRVSLFGGVALENIDAQVQLNGGTYSGAISTAAVARQAGVDAPNLGQAARDLSAGNPGTAAVAQLVTEAGGFAQAAAIAGQITPTATSFAANGGYSFDMDRSTEANYVIGAAYEIPEIALRIAGTYRFETEHTAKTTEHVFGVTTKSDVEFVTPQSFNLEMQTGIADGTLLTASYRWTEFSAVDLIPTALGEDLVNLDDGERYTLGVARRFSEKLAASATLAYEPKGDELVSPLGPTNGLVGLSLGARFTDGPLNISGGISYNWVGDAKAEVADTAVAEFTDNHVLGLGLQAQFKF